MISANEKIMLSVVSSWVTSPFLRTVRCSGLLGSNSVSIHGPKPPVASKFLPWVTLNWPCRVQSRMVPALAADHDGDLAFVVELLGDFRPHQLLARADHGIRRAIKHARIFRIVGDI